MRRVSVRDRRRALVRRHNLGGDGKDPVAVARALVALHATDPASVYLSVLARSAVTTLADVSAAMYERRSLVRWMAMRRTLFVLPVEDVPTIHAAVSAPLAVTLRRRLISRLDRLGMDPPDDGDLVGWLAEVEDRVEEAVTRRGAATGIQLAVDVPELATLLAAHAPTERPQRLTTSLLTLMGTSGRLVRGTPTGAWTSRQHRWEPAERWWPDGLPVVDQAAAQRELARRWLTRFGPATSEDLQWWTGWSKTTTARALASLKIVDVDLHGRPGIALTDPLHTGDADCDDVDSDDADFGHGPEEPVAALLPALDPTPMGWKHRDWFVSIDPATVFDQAGNIGPTLWWDGEIIGSWAITATGDVRIAIVLDRGRDARTAIDHAAERLHDRLGHTPVTPAVRTPLEVSLTLGLRT